MGLFVTTFGAALTTLLGVFVGGVLSHRLQQRQWSRDRQAEACARILRESANVLLELGKLQGRGVTPADEGARVPIPIDWRPWNEALATLALVADHRIVAAAQAIDRAFWPVGLQVARGWATDSDWYRLRNGIEDDRRDFVNVARKHLASPGPPLRRLTGRPDLDDPIWTLHRSYFSSSED
ncbi:hypothetical protein [Actinomadura geliboluensis]|uniref:Uncharacterized protein n=1 Tax=Actinomadura geliboluensis TaxID=882440 RepID=A0A5S4H7B0_9ACTN|nr:hypothetical protein [Actinomadura geliboluensis]TMR40886.1 hypothetical protein ETD96_08380 [Actinomadura geliboluensis]